jgi:DME family drug/metabolite transporter
VAEPALKVACYRSAVAAVALLLFFRPRVWRGTLAFLVAIVSYAGCVTTFVVATKWTTAANAIFLQYSGVVWVLLFSPIVLDEPRRARDAVAITLAFAGMGLFFVGELELHGRAGDLVAVLSGVLFAAVLLSLRREREFGAAAAVTYGNVLTALALLPLLGHDLTVSPRSGALLAYLGIVQIAGAYVLFVRGIQSVPATQASLIGMLEPVANPVWVFLLLGERPRPTAIAGGLVVLGAVAWRTVAGGTATSALPAPD